MTVFYIDIETSNLKGSHILQVSGISQSNSPFNAFCDVSTRLPSQCTKITGLFVYKNRLFLHGREVNTLPEFKVLESFMNWLSENSDDQVYLLGHNSFAFDFKILFAHYAALNIEINRKLRLCDTLPILKKLYAGTIENFQLTTVANFFDIKSNLSHSGLGDAIVLKQIHDAVIRDKKLDNNYFLQTFKKPRDFQNDK